MHTCSLLADLAPNWELTPCNKGLCCCCTVNWAFMPASSASCRCCCRARLSASRRRSVLLATSSLAFS